MSVNVSGRTALETRPTRIHGPVTLFERQIAYALAPCAAFHEVFAVPGWTEIPVTAARMGTGVVLAGNSLCSSAAICAAVRYGRGTAWPRRVAVPVACS